MKLTSILLLFLILQACSSSSTRSQLSDTQALEKKNLPDCSRGQVLKQSELDIFKGRTPQNPVGWNRIAKCYLNRGEIGVSELFYEKTIKEQPENFTALNGLLNITVKKKNYSQSIKYISQLQRQFGNKIEVWEQSARLALNYYDLPMASQSVSKLKRFNDKKFYQLYNTYLLTLRDQKTQALTSWNTLNPELYKNWPEAAFTAAYLGYLLDDKIKARKFLNTAGEDANPKMFDKISRLVE